MHTPYFFRILLPCLSFSLSLDFSFSQFLFLFLFRFCFYFCTQALFFSLSPFFRSFVFYFFCLPLCLPCCLFIFLSVCLFIFLSIYLWLAICVSLCLSASDFLSPPSLSFTRTTPPAIFLLFSPTRLTLIFSLSVCLSLSDFLSLPRFFLFSNTRSRTHAYNVDFCLAVFHSHPAHTLLMDKHSFFHTLSFSLFPFLFRSDFIILSFSLSVFKV